MRKMVYFLLFALIGISCHKQSAEEQFVLINVDTLDRVGIAEELNYINTLKPKLVALDIQFSRDTDAYKDSVLISALRKTRNLFMISIIDDYDNGSKDEYERFGLGSLPVFLVGAKTGFANTVIEEDILRTQSRFSTHEYVAGNTEYHFGVRVAMSIDSLRAIRFVENNPRTVYVDYKNGDRRFKMFNSPDVLGRRVSMQDIEGKIVMLGFLGPGNEDKFFTPLNTNPDEPDMYGMVYLAHVAAQVIESE